MNDLGWRTFVWAVLLGLGFRFGWGLMGLIAMLIVWVVSRVAGPDAATFLR